MTAWSDWGAVAVTPEDWAEAFEAADPGTPHNEAREAIFDELVAILVERHRRPEVPPELLAKALARNREVRTALYRAWPMLDPAELVGDLWTVPAYLRLCAPWLTPDEVQRLRRPHPHAWTLSDLPVLDAARQRLGDPEVAARQRRRKAALAAEREHMDRVIEDL